MTYPTSIISKHLLLNCSFILSDEARVLSKRYSRDYAPIYSEDDVYNTFKLYTVYNQYDTLFQLDDIVSFQWLKNSHCVGAAQLQLILMMELKRRKYCILLISAHWKQKPLCREYGNSNLF